MQPNDGSWEGGMTQFIFAPRSLFFNTSLEALASRDVASRALPTGFLKLADIAKAISSCGSTSLVVDAADERSESGVRWRAISLPHRVPGGSHAHKIRVSRDCSR